jgi:hypothetical protein
MGSEISSFVIEPLIGAGAVALAIFAIMDENKGKKKSAMWLAIAAIVVTIILIIVNMLLSMFG